VDLRSRSSLSMYSLNVTWLIHMCDMTHLYACNTSWHDSFICLAWLIYMHVIHRDMTHSYVWHDSSICTYTSWHDPLICVTWLMYMHDSMTWLTDARSGSSLSMYWLNVTWLIHMFDMTHPYMWLDSQIRIQGLRSQCTDSMWHDSFIRVTWLMYMHASFTCVIRLTDSRSRSSLSMYLHNVTRLIDTCDMTHPYTWLDSQIRVQGLHCQCTDSIWHDSFICVAWLMYVHASSTCMTRLTDSRSRSSLSMYLYCMSSCSFLRLIGKLNVYLKIIFSLAAVRDVSERLLRVYHTIPNTYQNNSNIATPAPGITFTHTYTHTHTHIHTHTHTHTHSHTHTHTTWVSATRSACTILFPTRTRTLVTEHTNQSE